MINPVSKDLSKSFLLAGCQANITYLIIAWLLTIGGMMNGVVGQILGSIVIAIAMLGMIVSGLCFEWIEKGTIE